MKRPTFTVLIDCHRELLTYAPMRLCLACVNSLIGTERMGHHFWVTSDRVKSQLMMAIGTEVEMREIATERFHGDTLDLYLVDHDPGEPSPIGRIVNFTLRDWPFGDSPTESYKARP